MDDISKDSCPQSQQKSPGQAERVFGFVLLTCVLLLISYQVGIYVAEVFDLPVSEWMP
jgi:hypothetical protein